MARLSGLQKEVLGLYRKCLRECRKKPEATRDHFKAFARTEFEKNIKVDKRDFSAIEFLLRKGSRQLEIPSVARRAAEEVFRKPLSLSLQKLRRAQAKRHATKVRVSFVHSNGSQNRLSGSARKRSSRHHRKPSPPKQRGDGAIPVIWQGIDYRGPKHLKKRSGGSYARVGPRDPSSSHEEQCCLGSPSKKTAEKPPGAYWGEMPKSPVKSPPKVPMPPAREPLLHISRDKRSVVRLSPKGPIAPMPRPRPSPGTPTPKGKTVARPTPVRLGDMKTRNIPLHTQTWVPPETWGSTNRQFKPSKKASGGNDRSNSRHLMSRFYNRRKAANKLIELEETQQTSKKPDSPPAIHELQESLRTVKELLPYQDQFRAAGLAVTSKEQKAYHRRGKLAPLLGKMSPGSEWLRLDGGIETKELINNEMQKMIIAAKKDDSPSPINVEQISQKSGDDKLSNALPLPTKRGSNGQEDSKAAQPEKRPSLDSDDGGKENITPIEPKFQTDKTLPALPRVFSQVLVRHGSGPSRNSSWSAAMRQGQFPPTIMEQKEPDGSPNKHSHPIHKKAATTSSSIKSATTSYGTATIIQPQSAKSYGQLLQIRNTKQGGSVSDVTFTTTKTPCPSVISGVELPVPVSKSGWTTMRTGTGTGTGTPTSLEKALDEAVRRLQAMGEGVGSPSTVRSSEASLGSQRTRRKGEGHKRVVSKTAQSPSQKLLMAKAKRAEKMLDAAMGKQNPRSKETASPTGTVKRVEEVGSSPASTVKRAGEVTPSSASTVKRVEEAGSLPVSTTTEMKATGGVPVIWDRVSSGLAKGAASSPHAPPASGPLHSVLRPSDYLRNDLPLKDHQPVAKPAPLYPISFTPPFLPPIASQARAIDPPLDSLPQTPETPIAIHSVTQQ
ncbi:hypothetical protein B0T20DRAFT_462984 [Sordaria brevicollis]|uniref:Complex 1 LYR protein domain-containing protein n=1 Tax=Sordaria brevicollis TaxID=83679 RepID=A0AAE0UAG8_SORBR|nr:hypothetical protein B0T20DRAFT_462984 [Sordaria brevicollis]